MLFSEASRDRRFLKGMSASWERDMSSFKEASNLTTLLGVSKGPARRGTGTLGKQEKAL